MNEPNGSEQPKAQPLMKPQTIISLRAQNVKKLSAVHIFPSGAVIGIGGKNEAGKSTVLDSILYAFGGGNVLPEMPIRKGKVKAQIVIETQDLVVKRTFSATGAQLVVTAADGSPISSPQGLLDKLTGSLSFDPAGFSTTAEREPKKALEILRKLVGLDFTKLDEKRAAIYTERTGVNRDITQKQGRITAFPLYEGVGDTEVTTAELLKKLETAQATNKSNAEVRAVSEKIKANITEATRILGEHKQEIASLEAKLELMKKQASEMEAGIVTVKAQSEEFDKNVAKLVDADEESVKSEMATTDSKNEKIRANKQRRELQKELATLQTKEATLTEKIEAIDKEKADQLAAAKFPIPELSFDDAGILLAGVPFSQGSSAERLRASLAIGIALNPTLRVILIRDGSLLDEDSLALVADMAEKAGIQVWLERVGTGKECQVIITDGHVEGAEEEAEA